METREEKERELREQLSEEAYKVTQEGATEPAFTGKYYKTKDDGMYRCIVCDTPLFDSTTKFDSHSGWPSFYETANTEAVKLTKDDSLGMTRTEVKCAKCDAHLGHVFDDATETPTGQRFCINSCALDLDEKRSK